MLPIGLQIAGLAGLVLAVPLTAVVVSVAQGITDILAPEQSPTLPEIVPTWLDRVAQWSWRALVGIAFVALLGLIVVTLPLVTLPVILALIFASTVLPLFDCRAAPRAVTHGSLRRSPSVAPPSPSSVCSR